MIKQTKRVVITGMGTVNSLGLTVEDTWSNLLAGKSGIAPITLFDSSVCNVHIAGEVHNFDPGRYMDPKEARRRDRFCQLAVAATQMALAEARLTITEDLADDIGCIYGTGTGGMGSFYEMMMTFFQDGVRRIVPYIVSMVICDSASDAIAIDWNLRGPNFAPVSACAAAADAIGLAYQAIKVGQAKAFVAGGSEAPIHRAGITTFDRLGAMSRRNDQLQRACKPFDRNRSGIVMGEGAATLILEDLEFAQARGATILAEIIGYGATADAFHLVAPAENGVGAERAIRRAICDAGIELDEIDWISAHGTATDLNDKYETAAIKRIFGEQAYRVPVSGTKAATGHMMGATGALEVIFGVKAIRDGWIPPTLNYETLDPECDLDYVPNLARQRNVKTFMSHAFGFGGHNAVLIVRRFEG